MPVTIGPRDTFQPPLDSSQPHPSNLQATPLSGVRQINEKEGLTAKTDEAKDVLSSVMTSCRQFGEWVLKKVVISGDISVLNHQCIDELNALTGDEGLSFFIGQIVKFLVADQQDTTNALKKTIIDDQEDFIVQLVQLGLTKIHSRKRGCLQI